MAQAARTPGAPPSLLARRLTAQLLTHASATTVTEVVQRLLAVQAQDPRGMRLAIRSRSSGLRSSDVDRALSADRSVVVSTLNRGTLHLVLAEDYWWLHPLTTPQLTPGVARRLAQELVLPEEADRAVAIVEKSLSEHGPLTRNQLRGPIARAGVRVNGQALAHIITLATLRGLIVRGPVVGSEQAFVLVRDWLGRPPRPMERGAALGRLARRYLAGHGPAEAADLAKWAGINLTDARRGLAGVLGAQAGAMADLPDGHDEPGLPAPRLLGSFDPSLHGWVSREQIVGDHQGIVTSNGLFRPIAMVKGKAVATWTVTAGEVSLSRLTKISAADDRALHADALSVMDYLGA